MADSASKRFQEAAEQRKSEPLTRRVSEGPGYRLDGEGEVVPLIERKNVGKSKTLPALSGSKRREDMRVSDEGLAKLHLLSESFTRTTSGTITTQTGPIVDSSDAAILAWWGKDGSWTFYAQLPEKIEKPYTLRTFRLLPNRGSATQLAASCGVGVVNIKGRKSQKDKTIGQDNFSVSRLASGWDVYCVMDGHGTGGEWPATRAVRTLPYLMQASSSCVTMLKQGKPGAALKHAFELTEIDLETESDRIRKDIQLAGSTASVVLRHPTSEKIWVATAGDSTCILLAPGRGLVYRTQDHKPSRPDEAARIEASGCEVERTKHDDGWVEERVVIKGEKWPGLSMTRSLGDCSVKAHGVVAEPEVCEWDVKGLQDGYVLAASDGLWEFIEAEVITKFVLKCLADGNTPDEVCNKLVAMAKEKWLEDDDEYCDDITILLIPVTADKKPPAKKEETGCCGGKSCTLM